MARSKEDILNEMLAALPASYDKTEGAVLYDMLAPISVEIAAREAEDDSILNNAFFSTADDEHKLIIAKDRANIDRKEAGYASGIVTITGIANTVIAAGSLFASDTVTFATDAENTIGTGGTCNATVTCTTAGICGNVAAGAIDTIPVTISGVTNVTNTASLTNGYEAESMEDLEKRYYEKIQLPATSGNAAHYKMWAKEVNGVGDAKVFPRTPSVGSVTVVIIDANKTGAETALVNDVQTYIDSVRPCPATCVVSSATEVTIAVSATITKASGDTTDYTTAITEAITAYLAEIAFTESYVSVAKVGQTILTVPGVLDYSNLQLNSGTANISISDTQVAVIGGVTIA